MFLLQTTYQPPQIDYAGMINTAFEQLAGIINQISGPLINVVMAVVGIGLVIMLIRRFVGA